MSFPFRSFALSSTCLGALILVLTLFSHEPRFSVDEIGRVRRHLEGAERMLASRDLSTLARQQCDARARRTAELREYRLRGVFPHNHRQHERTPVFVDEHGTRCAMAYLIERSGEKDLVARIAASRNLSRIRDLADDAELAAWLVRNGLTLAEAARIQPQYGETQNLERTSAIATAAIGAGLGFGGVVLNSATAKSQTSRNIRGLSGILLGLIGAGLGTAAVAADQDVVLAVGVLDIGMGLVSTGLGIRQLNVRPKSQALHASPVVMPGLRFDGHGSRQVAVTVRF